MNTPDTEWEEIANQIGLATYGGVSFQANPEYVEKIRNIITSRDTYWKERVRKEVEVLRKVVRFKGTGTPSQRAMSYNEAIDAVLEIDNLK